jgi:membrane-bound toxin of toxin-antitoxin system
MICTVITFISILLLNFNAWFKVMLLIALVYYVYDSLKINISRELQWQADGRWLIREKNIQQIVILQPGSVVTAFFALLKFKKENNKLKYVLLFEDNVNAEKFRKLRVRLKVEGNKMVPVISDLKDN